MSPVPTPPSGGNTPAPGQFGLLRQRRFAPFFWTQFCGAANDNLFKFALTVMVTYQVQVAWLPPAMAGLVIGALFILPFVFFSATAGQLTDKWEKTRMFRLVKNLEIAIMLLAAAGFALVSIPVLLACIFLMGLHSALFGPVKFAYLPQALAPHELTGGNGMVEMGTFVAILLGNMLGGILVAVPNTGPMWVTAACLALAVLGRWCAQRIPTAPATDPALQVQWNPWTQTVRNLRMARQQPEVFRALLGISWMWFFGAVFLAQFPSFAKEVLHGNAHVASLLLVVFSVGMGSGALLCEVLSRPRVEIGLVPLGAIGMSVFALDLWLATRALPAAELMGIGAFVQQPMHWRVMADLALMAMSAGIYSVPMYALIQLRSPVTHRARIIAANNILNALFMIASSVLAGVLLTAGLSIPQVFGVMGALNAGFALYVFWREPDYVLRATAWILARWVYRLQVQGAAQVPQQGAVVLYLERAAWWQALLVLAATDRGVRWASFEGSVQHARAARVWRWMQGMTLPAPTGGSALAAASHPEMMQALEAGALVVVMGGAVPVHGEQSLATAASAHDSDAAAFPSPLQPVVLHGRWQVGLQSAALSTQPFDEVKSLPRRVAWRIPVTLVITPGR